MNLTLWRRPATDDAVLGALYLDGKFECFTLERASALVPIGRYRVTITESERFGRVLPLVDVPGRSGIRIHPLNWPQESEGCIGVGQDHGVTNLRDSRLAMQALQPKIAVALARGEDVWLTIEDEPIEARTLA